MGFDSAEALVSLVLCIVAIITCTVNSILLWRRRDIYPLHAISIKLAIFRELSTIFAVVGGVFTLVFETAPCWVDVVVWESDTFPLITLIIFEAFQLLLRYQQNAILAHSSKKEVQTSSFLRYIPMLRSRTCGVVIVAFVGVCLEMVPVARVFQLGSETLLGEAGEEACFEVGMAEKVGDTIFAIVFPITLFVLSILLYRLEDAFRWSDRYKRCSSLLFVGMVFWQVSIFLNDNYFESDLVDSWAAIIYAGFLFSCSFTLSISAIRATYHSSTRPSSFTSSGLSENWTRIRLENGVVLPRATTLEELALVLEDRQVLEEFTIYLVEEFAVSLGQYYTEALEFQAEHGRRRNDIAKEIQSLYFSDSSTMQIEVDPGCIEKVSRMINGLQSDSPPLPGNLLAAVNREVLHQLVDPYQRFWYKTFREEHNTDDINREGPARLAANELEDTMYGTPQTASASLHSHSVIMESPKYAHV